MIQEIDNRLDRIVSAVSEVCGLPEEQIKGKSRRQDVVDARYLVFWLARKRTELTLTDIAWHVNRRQHGTVINGLRYAQAWVDNPRMNPEWLKNLQTAEEIIDNGRRIYCRGRL